VEWGLRIGEHVRVAALEGRSASLSDRWQLPLAEALVLRPLREQLGLKRAHIALTGGAAMAPDVFRLFAGIGVTLRNLYGCSEYGVISAHVGKRLNAETIGQPITSSTAWGPALELRLMDGGELQLRGGSGFAGYWGKPEKTAERMDGDWYRTGDAVGQTEDRRDLIYFDRLEDMSKLSGGQTYPKQYIEIRLRFSPYIKEVMVVGDERHDFVSAMVNIDGEVFAHWAEREGLSFTTFTDLSQRAEVLARVSQEIARVNRALPEHARVLRFANLPKELDPDEGELTRTRKLKREFIEERYRVLIDAMYGPAECVALEVPVRYQDGRSGMLRAEVCLGGDGRSDATSTREAN
jgi:long-chain acyl-CoA synthetase